MKPRTAHAPCLTASAFLVVILCCTCVAGLTAEQGYEYTSPAATGDGWQTASLSDVGIDEAPIVRLIGALQRRDDHLIHSIVIVKGGLLSFEEYFDGGDVDMFGEDLRRDRRVIPVEKHFTRDELHYCASVAKSVISQLFGIALDQGHIPGTDATMFSFFPDYASQRSPEKDQISLHHMLTMTSGLPFEEEAYPIEDRRNDAFRLFFSADPVEFMLSRDVVHRPGSTYQYNSGTALLLGEIIQRTTGQSVPSYAEEHLFGPLQISSARWVQMPEAPEVTHTPGGLYLRPRDMAKIGQLMLQDGVWDGRRVLSSDWIRRSITPETSFSRRGVTRGYGYQWRTESIAGFDAFLAAGWGGQYIVVLPGLDLVYVQTGGQYGSERIPVGYREIIAEYIVPATEEYRAQFASVDLSGEWIGHVIMGDGTRADIRMSLVRGEEGYSGSIRGNGTPIPEMELRDIVFEGNRLTFELDYPGDRGVELITFDLRYGEDRLAGSYTDPTGDSDEVRLAKER